MALSKRQKKHALKFFAAKNGERGCPVCGASSWKVETDAGLADVPPSGLNIQVIVIGCLNCEHFLLFNSNMIFREIDNESNETPKG